MVDASHSPPAADGPRTDAPRAEALRPTLRLTSLGKIVGQHPSIHDVVATVERVASSNCTVLITGENGTGKELVMAVLHDASTRAKGPLVTVNCSTIPDNLFESQLFGHVRGAFSGAVATSTGFVAAAEGGTLFLDEVGELPLAMQVKLLRLLQQREYVPVGESRPVHSDIRVVAATNRDLDAEIAAGRFREDLYYRLNVVHVHLPALRERPNDIDLLAPHFLRAVLARNARAVPAAIDGAAMDVLRRYAWPGNIRQLENVIERAVLLAPGPVVGVDDLPKKLRAAVAADTSSSAPPPDLDGFRASSIPPAPSVPSMLFGSAYDRLAAPLPFAEPSLPVEGVDLGAAVEAFENSLIVQALRRTGGNRNRAAQLLHMNRTTLIEKIRRKRLDG